MQTIFVQAADGVRVPFEDRHREAIVQTPVSVPASAYYLRRINDGDLIQVEATNKPKPKGDK